MANLRSQAKKSSKGSALRSKAKGRKSASKQEPDDPENPTPPQPPSILPSGPPDVPKAPMPRFGYLTSFATIPSLRKGGGLG